MYKGIIFDFNGTLFDDTDLQEDAWAIIIKKYLKREIGAAEFSDHIHGLANPDILEYLNAHNPFAPLSMDVPLEKEEVYRQLLRDDPSRVKFTPGAEELFDQLKKENIPFAIATASEITNVSFFYEIFRLDRWFDWDHIVYDTQRFPCKPAPDIYLEAARRLSLEPADCIVCEDSLNGVRAAECAGIGLIIARKPILKPEVIAAEPGVSAVIEDFNGFYDRFMKREILLPGKYDAFPENTVILSGESLLSVRHMLTPPTLQTYIRCPQDPSHVWWVLSEEYPQEHELTLINGKEYHSIKLSDLSGNDRLFDGADALIIPPMPEQYAFETFQNTVAILRGPNGCPWDKKQTHQSLRDDLLQEVYELLDGLDRNNMEMVTEELGDVLLHIVLQSQIGNDEREFTMGEAIAHINDKIIYRHEHVFGKPEDISADQVLVRWEQIKQKEREKQNKKGGLLDGINRSMPALSMAFSYQKRAAKVGFDWNDVDGVWDKLKEELNEFRNAETYAEKEEELGDILFTVVNLARWYKIDPETALRMANLKFYDRVHYVEERAKELGKDLFAMPLEEKDRYWDEYKAAHK